MITERPKARQDKPMTNAEVFEELRVLAKCLCTDAGKERYRRLYAESWRYWEGESDFYPEDGEDYREDMRMLRHNARTDAIGDLCDELGLQIGQSVIWTDQTGLSARWWSAARDPEKLAKKLYALID